MIPTSSEFTRNVPVRVLGWEHDEVGGARVELLAAVGSMQIGTEAKATIRQVVIGRQPLDFSHLKKGGLRVGGIVLLRKVVEEADGAVSAKSVETLLHRESDGLAIVLHSAAASIVAPPPGTAMVNECIVAMTGSAAAVTACDEGLMRVKASLTQACQFGRAGLIFTGEDRDGSAAEVIIGGDEVRTPEEILELFSDQCPREVAMMARKARLPWRMVPFFRGEVDPDRSSRISAQRANFDYGVPDELLWTGTNAVLRAYAETWLVCDVTPGTEVQGHVSAVLLDLIESI